MFLTNLFIHKCTHEHILPDRNTAYCPDCGKLIENEWYITRCACCGVKLKAMVKKGKIVPQLHYCCNCGSEEFNVEKLDELNFIDIRFAALIKKEIQVKEHSSSMQFWQEKQDAHTKLIGQYY